MTTAANHYDQMLARHYSWMLGGDIPARAAEQARLLESLGITPAAAGTTAIDLGCGPGNQALALAALGFTPVLAVDTSSVLLDELAAHAGDNPAIQLVHADLCTVLPQIAEPGSAAVIVCMGDTLTHLSDKTDVTVLLRRHHASTGPWRRTSHHLSRSHSAPARNRPVHPCPPQPRPATDLFSRVPRRRHRPRTRPPAHPLRRYVETAGRQLSQAPSGASVAGGAVPCGRARDPARRSGAYRHAGAARPQALKGPHAP